MPDLLVLLQLLAIGALVLSVAESFRARPWWPQPLGRSPQRPPPRGSSPRERRWLHAGLALLLAGNVLSMEFPEDRAVWTVGMVGLLAGLALVVFGLVRGPSEQELARYRQERRQADGSTSRQRDGSASPPRHGQGRPGSRDNDDGAGTS